MEAALHGYRFEDGKVNAGTGAYVNHSHAFMQRMKADHRRRGVH